MLILEPIDLSCCANSLKNNSIPVLELDFLNLKKYIGIPINFWHNIIVQNIFADVFLFRCYTKFFTCDFSIKRMQRVK